MEDIILYICEHAHVAHFILFAALMLAGLNIPISEDLVLLSGGMIVSTCIPDHFYLMWFWLYLGCALSAWEAFYIGRIFGPKLYNAPWIKRHFTRQRVDKLNGYYEHFGIFTFIVGRFIPGGVRNALFMTAGLGKMPFWKFMLRDEIACLLSATTLFYIGFLFGENWDTLYRYFKNYNRIAFGLILFLILFFVIKRLRRSKEKTQESS